MQRPPVGKIAGIIGFASLLAGMAWFSAHNANDVASRVNAKLEKIDAQVQYATEMAEYADRVVNLPEDAANWYVTVFTASPATQQDQQLVAWFDSDPQLKRIKGSTHFAVCDPTKAVYSRYANVASGGASAVLVQDPKGAVVYKASGAGIPNAPWPLLKGIKECILAHCPHLRPCPCPKPPAPVPQPSPLPAPSPIPDIGPPDAGPVIDGKDETLVMLLLFAGGIVVACMFNWKKTAGI